ncbi:MAG: hydrogenase maturation protease, partial [Candidatus Omnitrophota bacterium]|nr:hydrogenase maturation protease [Candidatus Omnitrophota bacterium]
IELIRPDKINAALFDCGTAPENYILPILSTNADTIIFVDAADSGSTPGTIKILSLEEISTVSFSTHSPSPRLFIDLLKTGKDDLNIFFISIQPKHTNLGQSLTEEVMDSLNFLKSVLVETLG